MALALCPGPHPKSSVSSIAELIAFAKANPDKLQFASPGAGSFNQLRDGVAQAAGRHPARACALSGGRAGAHGSFWPAHVDIMFDNAGNVVSLIRTRLKALAVSSKTRIARLPDVPAMAEYFRTSPPQLVPVVAPRRRRPISRPSSPTPWSKALRMPDVASRVRELSATVVAARRPTPQRFLAKEAAHWRQVIATAEIKAE